MRTITLLLTLLILNVKVTFAQQNYQMTLYATNTAGKTDSVIVGVDSLATDGIDASFGETLLHKSNMDSVFSLFVLGKQIPVANSYLFIKPDSITKKQIVSPHFKRAYIYLLSKDTNVIFSWKFDASKTIYKNSLFRTDPFTACYIPIDLGDDATYLKSQTNRWVSFSQDNINFGIFTYKNDRTLFNVNYRTYVVFIQFNTQDICTVSLDEDEQKAIQFYPNPANSKLFITTNNSYDYALYTLAGQALLTGNVIGQNAIIDVSNLVQGQYYIRLTNSATTFTKKIIIQ